MLIHLGVLLISCVALGLELALMRSLSISHWHHFAYMIISVALLGFGVSGTFIALTRRTLLKRPRLWMAVFALLLAASVPVCFHLAKSVPFNVLELGWRSRQYLYLAENYLLYLLPFLFGGCVIGLALAERGARIGTRYAVNLLGTGLGAAVVMLLMHVLAIPGLMRTLAALACLAAVFFALSERRRFTTVGAVVAAVAVAAGSFAYPFDVNISEFKTLSHYQRLEAQGQARTIARRFGPLGRIDVIESPHIHATPPGLSLNFTGQLPEQRLMVIDGEGATAVSRIAGDLSRAAFLDYTTEALPYHLLRKPRAAIVGPGGGDPVLLARLHNASSVTAVELDAKIIGLMRGPLREFSGGLYDLPGVRVVCTEGRLFFETTDERFDLIELALVDSLAASAAGTNALNESYLYTVEAFRTYLNHLSEGGILSVTRWLKLRPVPAGYAADAGGRMEATDVVKLLAVLSRAMREEGFDPGLQVVVIRSWATATALAKRGRFSPDELARVRAFAAERSFDLIYLSDMRPGEANRRTVLKEPIYHRAAHAILAGDADGYIRGHPFAVEPATDSRPYFFNFFRWGLLIPLLGRMGTTEWVPFVDWGYIALVATLVQAALLSVVLIVLPLLFVKRGGRRKARRRPSAAVVFGYFLCLGVAFMFLEITYIQRMIRFLWHPVYSVAVVVAGFLVFAGLGSAAAERVRLRAATKVALAAGGICLIAVAEQFFLPVVFADVAKASFAVRGAVALAAIAPLAFFMGVPFPTGLAAVSRTRADLLPWAWGVNGFASVVATVLATILAASWGFHPVTWAALAAYLAAAFLARSLSGD